MPHSQAEVVFDLNIGIQTISGELSSIAVGVHTMAWIMRRKDVVNFEEPLPECATLPLIFS